MKTMTPDEYKAFLSSGTKTGKLATVRADGRPHVAPVWFHLDGDDLLFNTWHESVKAKNIGREPRVSICVDEEVAPYAFVIIEGTVTVSEDPDDILRWATKIGGRYMGADLAEDYGRRNGGEGELLVRVHPTKIIAKKEISA